MGNAEPKKGPKLAREEPGLGLAAAIPEAKVGALDEHEVKKSQSGPNGSTTREAVPETAEKVELGLVASTPEASAEALVDPEPEAREG